MRTDASYGSGRVKARAMLFAVPVGTSASGSSRPTIASATSATVPSPPAATTASNPPAATAAAQSWSTSIMRGS